MENSERILQDVEEARMMVISWRQERYEKQIAKAATTIARMRAHRIMKLVEQRLWGKNVSRMIRYEESITTDQTYEYRVKLKGAYHLLKKYKWCKTREQSDKIVQYARATELSDQG